MKRYLTAAVVLMVIPGMVLVCVGQEGERPAGRAERARGRAGGAERLRGAMRGYLEAQRQALNAIEEEVKKMKTAIDEPQTSSEEFQQMSRQQRMERFTKMREERQKSIDNVEGQLVKLKGARAATAEHNKEIGKFKALAEQAKEENATETAATIEKMIAEKEKAFDEMLKKLGMQRSSGRSRTRRPRGQRGGNGGGEN